MIREEIPPARTVKLHNKTIKCYDEMGSNIDPTTVSSFGEEWKAFNRFNDKEIDRLGDRYFDIVPQAALGPQKTAADFGCGTGRWSKYLAGKVGTIAAIDPSDAIFTAAGLLEKQDNVALYKASIDNLPFADGVFDFGFSLGVLHHIPDTGRAMNDCVRKIKPGGYFLVYLYYRFDNRGVAFKLLFQLSNLIRLVVSKMPPGLKRLSCDVLAVTLYMPFVGLCRLLRVLKVPYAVRQKIPLQIYESTSFYIIRNDALDRFGTPLEQRFTRQEITAMMAGAGLTDITFSENDPFWHAIGRKK